MIYSRFWNKFLYDLGYVCEDEPFRKLINQGMIQGRSSFAYRVIGTNTFVSLGKIGDHEVQPIHVSVNIVHNDRLDLEAFKASQRELEDAEFILEDDGSYICGNAVEKMSKSYLNVVNPDDIIKQYGADTLRVYEMFLGPIEQSKPWDTNGIDGAFRFLRRVYGFFFDDEGKLKVTDDKPSKDSLKSLHTALKKVTQGIESYSFNTCVSAMMVCANELASQKCTSKELLQDFIVMLSPFAPHLAEEVWHALGHDDSVVDAKWPELNEDFLKESTITYPISFNGKVRFTMDLAADLSKAEIEEIVTSSEETQRYLEGKKPGRVIVVPHKIVNIVLGK